MYLIPQLRVITLGLMIWAVAAQRKVGRAIINNHCDYEVYCWSIPQAEYGKERGPIPLAPGKSKSESFTRSKHVNGTSHGVSLKISKTNGLTNICQFEYTLD